MIRPWCTKENMANEESEANKENIYHAKMEI